MPSKKRTTPSHPKAPRISINGQYLDELRTRLHYSRDTGGVSYTLRPEEHHRVAQDAGGVTLCIPLITAVQLYHDGVLPVDHSKAVEIAVDAESLGIFTLEWLRKPAESHNDRFGESILLRWKRSSIPDSPASIEPRYTDLGTHSIASINTITPLKLHPRGMWDPAEEYWGEEGEPTEDWAKPIIAKGPRPMFEMEQIIPGEDPEDFDSDPILQASALRERGRAAQARVLMTGLIEQDVRCLDAHAHLGNIEFDRKPKEALKHYQRGVEISRLSLGDGFNGVLPWGVINNRPFLRCLHGYGLCLWRLGRFEEAESVFEELLWLSPSDNQGVRFILPLVRARRTRSPE